LNFKVSSKVISIVAVFIMLSPALLNNSEASTYRSPELYELGTVLINGSTIERYANYNTTIEIVVRTFAGDYLDDIELDVTIETVDGGNLIQIETLITSRKTAEFASALLELDGEDYDADLYDLTITSYDGVNPDAISHFYIDMKSSAGVTVPYPISVFFMSNYLYVGSDIEMIVEFSERMNFVRCLFDRRYYLFEQVAERKWSANITFLEDGSRQFNLEYTSEDDISSEFVFDSYVNGYEIIDAKVYVMFRERIGLTIPIVFSEFGGNASAYYTETTLHLYCGAKRAYDIVIDFSSLDSRTVERGWWIFKHDAQEIQSIVGGLDADAKVVYVYSKKDREVGGLFGDVVIRDINDWRTLWGTFSQGDLVIDYLRFKEYGIESAIDSSTYDDLFLVSTDKVAMVVEYK